MKAMSKLWIYSLCLLTSAIGTDVIIPVHKRDIIDSQAGSTFIFRTWSYSDRTLIIKVKQDNITLVDAFFDRDVVIITEDQNDRLILKHHVTTKTAYLSFRNISRNDQGLYEINEGLYEINEGLYETASSDPFERKDGKWNFQINVIELDEVKRGNVGENIIIMEFKKTSESIPGLYLYDKIVARLIEDDCEINTKSQLYGRLICASDGDNKNYRIEIQNVTQRDAGLYKVDIEGSRTEKCFLNITDKSISAAIGDNLTIGWFYNKQGMNRTLRVIHPNKGVMMKLTPANVKKIRGNFQHRIFYSGEIVRSFMSFTLLNLDKSDSGVYTIETLHGNVIPGQKQLRVEGTVAMSTSSKDIHLDEGSTDTVDSQTRSGSFLHTVSRSTSKTFSSRLNDVTVQTSLEVIHYSRSITESITPSVLSSSTEIPNPLLNVPVYVIPLIIGAYGVINLVICCLIRIQRKNTHSVEAERPRALEECDTDLYLTPIAVERPLPIPWSDDVRTDHSNTAQNAQFNSKSQVLPMTHSLCMDGYEEIHISSNDDIQNTPHNKEITGDSTETSTTPFLDTFEYLKVEDVMESSV